MPWCLSVSCLIHAVSIQTRTLRLREVKWRPNTTQQWVRGWVLSDSHTSDLFSGGSVTDIPKGRSFLFLSKASFLQVWLFFTLPCTVLEHGIEDTVEPSRPACFPWWVASLLLRALLKIVVQNWVWCNLRTVGFVLSKNIFKTSE